MSRPEVQENFDAVSESYISPADHALALPAVLHEILTKLRDPRHVCFAAQVNKSWSAAARDARLWRRLVAQRYGTLYQPSQPPLQPTSWHSLFKKLHTFHHQGLTGWCEDRITAGGQPYTMQLAGFTPGSVQLPALLSNSLGTCNWAYSNPPARTQVSMWVLRADADRMTDLWRDEPYTRPARYSMAGHALEHVEEMPLRAVVTDTVLREGDSNNWVLWEPRSSPIQPAAEDDAESTTGVLPGFERRCIVLEYYPLPNSGPVDVPNRYFGFVCGSALIGTMLPYKVPMHLMDLESPEQMLGCFCLWSQELAELAAVHGEQQQQQYHRPQQGTHLLEVGSVFSGTVVTNYCTRHQAMRVNRGFAHLGQLKVVVERVVPTTHPSSVADHRSSSPPQAAPAQQGQQAGKHEGADGGEVPVCLAQLRVYMPERNWKITGCGALEPRDTANAGDASGVSDWSISCTLSGMALVEVLRNGTVRPAPPDAMSILSGASSSVTTVNTSGAVASTIGGIDGTAVAGASGTGGSSSSTMLELQLQPDDSSRHAVLMAGLMGVQTTLSSTDDEGDGRLGGFEVQGLLAGGAFMGLLMHSILGRAAFSTLDTALQTAQ